MGQYKPLINRSGSRFELCWWVTVKSVFLGRVLVRLITGPQILKEPIPFLAFRLKYSKNLNRKNRIWVQCSGLFLIWSLVPFISWTQRNSSPLAEDPKTLNKVFGPGIGPLM